MVNVISTTPRNQDVRLSNVLISSAFGAFQRHQFWVESMAPSMAPGDYDFLVDFGRP